MFTVILIDDEVIIRKGLRKVMPWGKLGYEIIAESQDGLVGFELIREIRGTNKKIDEKPQFIVNETLAFIQGHYNQKLSLQLVADSLYVSASHLCRVLKKETGTNFVNLLNETRINHAKEILITTNLRIYEVAGKVGYADAAYFSKIFKAFVKMTPNEYRNTQYCTINSKTD